MRYQIQSLKSQISFLKKENDAMQTRCDLQQDRIDLLKQSRQKTSTDCRQFVRLLAENESLKTEIKTLQRKLSAIKKRLDITMNSQLISRRMMMMTR